MKTVRFLQLDTASITSHSADWLSSSMVNKGPVPICGGFCDGEVLYYPPDPSPKQEDNRVGEMQLKDEIP